MAEEQTQTEKRPRDDDDEGVVVGKKLKKDIDRDAVAKLLSFYFGEANFRRDRFLQLEANKDKGFVRLSVLLTFNKLKVLVTSLEDLADIIATHELLKGELVLNDAKDRVKRAHQMDAKNDPAPRTVLVSGFSTENDGPEVEEIIDLFKTYGEIDLVRKRRGGSAADKTQPKRFLGQAFVEYATEASAEAAVAVSKAVGVKFGDQELSLVLLPEWIESNKKVRESQRKRKQEEDMLASLEYEEGLVLKLENIPADVTFQHIKDALVSFGYVAYAEHSHGDSVALVRFKEAETVNAAVEAIGTGGITLPAPAPAEEGSQERTFIGGPITVTRVTGEEEKEFWKRCAMSKNANKKGKGGRGGGRGGRDGRGGRGGRGGRR